MRKRVRRRYERQCRVSGGEKIAGQSYKQDKVSAESVAVFRVIDTKALPKDKVSLLSTVEFTNLVSEVRMKYTIVSPHEMDLSAGKYP